MDQIGNLANQFVAVATQTTCGVFITESDSVKEFDRIIDQSGLFRVRKEVWGRYVNGRPNVDDQRPRIDRILLPNKPLLDLGWRHGPIAIECKRSDCKLGRLVAQALDYSNAVFEIYPGFHVWCEWLFVWPLEHVSGDVESVMLQNRIGTCCPFTRQGENIGMSFKVGATNALRFRDSGVVDYCRELPQGRKRGNRG